MDTEDEVAYSCVTGHSIPADRMDEETETVMLDGGARVRICRLHGAPISVTIERPGRRSVADSPARQESRKV